MLKLPLFGAHDTQTQAAAFGRLCVETAWRVVNQNLEINAAAFGRLCVETSHRRSYMMGDVAAAFGGLCGDSRICYL